jgi:C1A family cysteine protease
MKRLLAFAFAGSAGSAGSAAAAAAARIDCRFRDTPPARQVNISVTNDCGASAKIRTCSANFTQCVGYMSSPNHYQDCPARVADGGRALLSLDDHRAYILIDCPGWWQPGIDNWWTVQPDSAGRWPARFTIPKHNASAAISRVPNAAAAASAPASMVLTSMFETPFAAYKQAFAKAYGTPEEEARREAILYDNLARADAANRRHGGEPAAAAATYGATQFSDLTREEFLRRYAQQQQQQPEDDDQRDSEGAAADHVVDTSSLPASIDWTTKNAVTPVKNQGQCGSCWVFAGVGAMEGALAIASGLKGAPVSLSEEEYLACYSPGYAVCNGGEASAAILWAKTRSLCTEEAYPYIAPTGKPFPPPPKLVCNVSNCSQPGAEGLPVGAVKGVNYVTPKSEAALMAAVAKQPVAISVWAGPLQNYRKGIMRGECMPYQRGDHAMLVVGYGEDAAGVQYWKIKNSYGPVFGEAGYMRVKRNDSACNANGGLGLLSSPVYPTVVL